jgi:3D (Asp-Asp-Asp) domain-containing protein
MTPFIGAVMGFFLLSGTNGALPADAFAVPPLHSYSVTLTAYNAVPSQTDNNPFITASGAYSNPEIVAARSRDLEKNLPFGTIIEIDGSSDMGNSCGYDVVSPIIGYRVIADTMNVRHSNTVDILFSTKSNYTMQSGVKKNASTILGICDGVTVRVVGYIDITNPKNLPKTQVELASIVKGDNNKLAIK